jgi:hypothetical protein
MWIAAAALLTTAAGIAMLIWIMSLKRYEDAVAVLREGFEHAPGDDRIKKKLMLAESYLEEQRWIEKQQRRNEDAVRDKKQSAQIRLSLIRCKKLTGNAAMSACNDGLDMVPEVPGVTH